MEKISDKIVYFEQGGASSQIVFTLPDGENLSKCLENIIPKNKNRLSKLRKTHKKGSISFKGWCFIVNGKKNAQIKKQDACDKNGF